jgi:magnesium transporter
VKVDNPLSREFLLNYPADAARALELVSVEDVAALFGEFPPHVLATVIASMLPTKAADCLAVMAAESAAKLLASCPVTAAARIYRLLVSAKQHELSVYLTDKTRSQIHHFLDYPPESVGALMDPGVAMLPENITVTEAVRRIERLGYPVGCEVYVIDDRHHYVGMIELGRLLVSNNHARVRDIINRKIPTVSAHANATSLYSHLGWSTQRRLPVVDRNNLLVGALAFARLQETPAETTDIVIRDPLENLLSLTSLYWLSVAQLLDSVLNLVRMDKGGRQ